MSKSSLRTYLLIPAMPTPNGRLHLGHIGGPFLAVDILSRHLKLMGNRTIVISGTDSFDSYVTGQAEKEGKTPEEICNHYHSLIESDLISMQIEFDEFINPLNPAWKEQYKGWLEKVLRQLQDAGATTDVMETVKIDDSTGRYLTGCWLPGFCPSCSAAVCGYFCEDCGAHFRPEEVIDSPTTKDTRTVHNLFMSLPQESNLNGRGLDQSISEVYEKFLNLQSGLLRLTANSEWGLPVGELANGDRFFNYPFAYAYALLMGELAAAKLAAAIPHAEKNNALASDSEIISIAAFGIDNTIPVLGSIDGITSWLSQYKHFDYYLVNHFLYLDGKKFSTSRRHAIWVNEAIHKLGASSDIIRLYLAGISVRSMSGNVELKSLHQFYNETADWINRLVIKRLTAITSDYEIGVTYGSAQILQAKLEAMLGEQSAFLSPDDYRPDLAAAAINNWIALGETICDIKASYFWWLKGTALLTYPFMPKLAKAIWHQLGYRGEPIAAKFLSPPEVAPQKNLAASITMLEMTDLEQIAGVPIS